MAAFKKMSLETTDDSMRSENHTDAKVSKYLEKPI
jgi:hypothetical protein